MSKEIYIMDFITLELGRINKWQFILTATVLILTLCSSCYGEAQGASNCCITVWEANYLYFITFSGVVRNFMSLTPTASEVTKVRQNSFFEKVLELRLNPTTGRIHRNSRFTELFKPHFDRSNAQIRDPIAPFP